ATHVELHHAHKDWAKGGLTDIDDLAPACPRHNRMVGTNPGQYTTRVVRDGPDEGRCAWKLNAEPGAPPNPEHINRRPDIPRRFAEHLNTVRDEIHGPPNRPGDQARSEKPHHQDPRRSWLKTSHVIDVRPPQPGPPPPRPSLVEAHLMTLLATH
ncbi:hypothetical protein GTC6_21820, partial [Gordonia terrae C-6]